MSNLLAWIVWNPSREILTIPWVHLPLGWYGLLFASGFFFGYLLFLRIVTRKLSYAGVQSPRDVACSLADALCWSVVLGTVVGARLGHVLFYAWSYYREHPLEILKVWQGGLASHGGTVGILLALYFYLGIVRKQLPQISYLGLVDMLAIPAALVGVFIRTGNFMNQEIVGTTTALPWGVLFGRPLDGPSGVPLHPVQLYEALWYLAVCVFLYRLWDKQGELLPTGALTGWLFTLLFGGRIFLEYFKATQGPVLLDGYLQLGQVFSIPFVLVGLVLLYRACRSPCSSAGSAG